MWRGLEASFRVKIWSEVFYELLEHPFFTPATQLLLLGSLSEHGHYARNFHAAGNWLTMEISGLATIATQWPELKAAKQWLQYSKVAMEASLKEQVYPDGVQTELTSHYHYVALKNFTQFMEICHRANESIPNSFAETLEKMWHYLAVSMRPDGFGLLNNDSDRDFNRTRIMRASQIFSRSDWEYIASSGQTGEKPLESPSRMFPWAGHFITRQNYSPDAHWAFFDIGPWGSGHQHNDKLHLSIAAFGHDFLVDAGRFAYRGVLADKYRKYARGTASHNTLLIDGKEQSAGPKITTSPLPGKHFKITDQYAYAWNSTSNFDGLDGKCTHTRSMIYLLDLGWIVVDHLRSDRPRQVEALWHWHPKCQIQTTEDLIVKAGRDQGRVILQPVGSSDGNLVHLSGQESPNIQGWYSEKYNQVEANTVSIYRFSMDEEKAIAWFIQPRNLGPPLVCQLTDQTATGMHFEISGQKVKSLSVFVPFADGNLVKLGN